MISGGCEPVPVRCVSRRRRSAGRKGCRMSEKVSFNINAELYENRFGDLAIRFLGEKVYREVGKRIGAVFTEEALAVLKSGMHPRDWVEMPAHELLYGQDWHCISRLGFVQGEQNRPAVEFEGNPENYGSMAKSYLKPVLH